jgi:hypothetical protein
MIKRSKRMKYSESGFFRKASEVQRQQLDIQLNRFLQKETATKPTVSFFVSSHGAGLLTSDSDGRDLHHQHCFRQLIGV